MTMSSASSPGAEKEEAVERGAGEGIGDNVVFAGSVTDVSGELGDVGKLALLAGGPGRGDVVKGGDGGLQGEIGSGE